MGGESLSTAPTMLPNTLLIIFLDLVSQHGGKIVSVQNHIFTTKQIGHQRENKALSFLAIVLSYNGEAWENKVYICFSSYNPFKSLPPHLQATVDSLSAAKCCFQQHSPLSSWVFKMFRHFELIINVLRTEVQSALICYHYSDTKQTLQEANTKRIHHTTPATLWSRATANCSLLTS